jgi:hypothetical protein
MGQLYVLNTNRRISPAGEITPYQITTVPQLTGISSRLKGLTIQKGISLSEMRSFPSLTRQIEIFYSDILLSERISQERERFEQAYGGFRQETIPEEKRIMIFKIENQFGDLLVFAIEIEEIAIENIEKEIESGAVYDARTFIRLHDTIKHLSENHQSLAPQVEQSSDAELIQRFSELGLRIEKLERKFDQASVLLISTNHDYNVQGTSSSYTLIGNTSDSDTIEDLMNQFIIQWFIDSLNAQKEEETEELAEAKRKKEEEMKAYLRRMKKKREELKILLKSIVAKLSAVALSNPVSLDEFKRLKVLASLIESKLKKLPIIDEKLPLAA